MLSLQHARKAIGSRQVRKSIIKGSAYKVYIAEDAEKHITRGLMDLCRERGIEVQLVQSMEQLGKACGISVGSAAVALLSDEQGKEVQD